MGFLRKVFNSEAQFLHSRMSKENCMYNCICIRAVRRRHGVGGGAPVNFGRRRAGPKRSAAAARRGRPKECFS